MLMMLIYLEITNKTKKITEDLLICGDDGLKVNADESKYICTINRMQDKNIGQK